MVLIFELFSATLVWFGSFVTHLNYNAQIAWNKNSYNFLYNYVSRKLNEPLDDHCF